MRPKQTRHTGATAGASKGDIKNVKPVLAPPVGIVCHEDKPTQRRRTRSASFTLVRHFRPNIERQARALTLLLDWAMETSEDVVSSAQRISLGESVASLPTLVRRAD
jgi:hypothetical protein